jgi:hypothetical protein
MLLAAIVITSRREALATRQMNTAHAATYHIFRLRRRALFADFAASRTVLNDQIRNNENSDEE